VVCSPAAEGCLFLTSELGGAYPSPHQGNPNRQTPAAVVQQSWLDAAPAPSPQAMRQRGVNDGRRSALRFNLPACTMALTAKTQV